MQSLGTWLLILLAGFAPPAIAVDGFFDPAFGINGRKLIDVSSGPRDTGKVLRIQPDGKLLMAGTCGKPETIGGTSEIYDKFCATRLRADGSYDTSFGPGGVGYIRFDRFEDVGAWPHNSSLNDMRRLQDGRILFVGRPTDGGAILVAALTSNGSALDTTVGGGQGFLTFKFGGEPSAGGAVLQQSDGKILVAGTGIGPNGNFDMAVQRFMPDLSVDAGFGNGGYQTVAFDLGGPSGNNMDIALGVTQRPDGGLLLAGYAARNVTGSEINVALASLQPDGQLDPTFGPDHDGRVQFAPDTIGFAQAIRVDALARIVYAGTVANSTIGSRCMINRLLADGSQDPGFNATIASGRAQIFTIPVSGVERGCSLVDLVDAGGGSLLAVGSVARDALGTSTYFAAVKLTPLGGFDASFGNLGKAIGTFAPPTGSSSTDVGAGIAIANGGLMIGGSSTNAAGNDVKFAIARLLFDRIFVAGFDG